MDRNILNRLPQLIYAHIPAIKKGIGSIPAVSSLKQHLSKDSALKEEGKNEQTKNEATKQAKDKQTMTDLIRKSNRCIISASTRFPWTLFSNTIEVEESRVNFVFRQFMSSQSHSVEIRDISNVFIVRSPFFATLRIVSRTFVQNDIKISHLKAKIAIRVQMIIEGLRTFAKHNIDTSNYEIKELIAKIEEFNKSKGA